LWLPSAKILTGTSNTFAGPESEEEPFDELTDFEEVFLLGAEVDFVVDDDVPDDVDDIVVPSTVKMDARA